MLLFHSTQHNKNRHASNRCSIGLEQEYTSHCPVILHRGFRRLRPGTRNSARASHQQRVPCCDRLRIYRRHWVGRQHPGKNWRKTSRIDWVRVPSYILLSDMSVGLWEELMLYFFIYFFKSNQRIPRHSWPFLSRRSVQRQKN